MIKNIEQNFNIPSDIIYKLNYESLHAISKLRKENLDILNIRLQAFEKWKTMIEPKWSFNYNIDYDNIAPLSKPKDNPDSKKQIKYLMERLELNINEKNRLNNIGVDFVLDSFSLATLDEELYNKYGIIFCSLNEAIIKFPNLVNQYINTVVPIGDNYFSTLNTAFFSDGTFVYIPANTKCPIDLSSYFRLDSLFASQFERTLIIVEPNSYLNYLEGCSAPVSKNSLLHSAVVEIIVKENSVVNYHTLQNWYAGNNKGEGGIMNFVTKRGICFANAELNWTQVEVGSQATWKYPSTILLGDYSKTTFFSLAYTKNYMWSDTGTKAIHLGSNTTSYIVSKSIVDDYSKSNFRFKIKSIPKANNCSSFSLCDTLIKSKTAISNSLPVFEINSSNFNIQHEAKTFKIGEDMKFFLQLKGFDELQADKLILTVFCSDIIAKLPDEFYSEIFVLLETKIEGNG